MFDIGGDCYQSVLVMLHQPPCLVPHPPVSTSGLPRRLNDILPARSSCGTTGDLFSWTDYVPPRHV